MKFLLLIGMSFWTSGCYLVSQGWSQGRLLFTSEPVSEVMNSDQVDDAVRTQLRITQGILSFAEENGLDVGNSYTEFIDVDRRFVSFLVQAAYPDRLESVKWWFPIVGEVPYIGYYDEVEQKEEVAYLKSLGYDVYAGYAAAFSALGYIDDPIFSSMLRRDKASLAHLFFHELTHRTIWLPGSVKFNENLAEFVGEYLTERYLINDKKLYNTYQLRRSDNEQYRAWLKSLRQDLKKLYSNKNLNRDDKLEQKKLLFAKYTKEKLPSFKTKYFSFVSRREWNNAMVLGASLYSPDTKKFEDSFVCSASKNMKDYISALRQAVQRGVSGDKILKAICKDGRA